jgi:SAM-dependent methyltransferase
MDPRAMAPFGAALRGYVEGDTDAELFMHRDDGLTVSMPARHFFRPPSEFTRLETVALERCAGRVLDCGAGAGPHSLVLQERGLSVTAIDLSREAVEVMTRRGVRDARHADATSFRGGPFDTVLLLGHTIGVVETVDGLDAFLRGLQELVADGGQVILDSLDVRATDDPVNLAYHEANRRAGRYVGEIRDALEFRGVKGPVHGWLQVDEETLAAHAARAGWNCEVLAAEPGGEALFRLSRAASG